MPPEHLLFEYPLTIREGHLDTFGHVNNAVYLQLFEEARWEILHSRGFGMERIVSLGQGPTILEIQLKFLRELRLRQEVVIRSRLESHAGKVAVMLQWIETRAGERCCEARFTFGLFDTRQRKLIAPTPEWLRAIGAAGA
jgi:thioesterase III